MYILKFSIVACHVGGYGFCCCDEGSLGKSPKKRDAEKYLATYYIVLPPTYSIIHVKANLLGIAGYTTFISLFTERQTTIAT